MKTISLIIMTLILQSDDLLLFDFNSTVTSGKWYKVNDGVMGGLSQSSLVLNDNGTATFSGNVSLENNGGFASVRTPISKLSSYNGVVLRLKGDGKIYSIRFRNNSNFDGYAYQAKIITKENLWMEYKIPFSDFKATYRGRTLMGKPALKSEDIAQMGILIADKQMGDFNLVLDWIKLYE